MFNRGTALVRDLAGVPAAALRESGERQFDAHPFVARRGIALAERHGWIRWRKARGPQGGEFTVGVTTPAGVARAATPWCKVGRPEQQTCSAAVKSSAIGPDSMRRSWRS